MFARDATTDSGALNLGNIISTVAKFIKREDEELLARSPFNFPRPNDHFPTHFAIARDDTTASGAFNLGSIISTIGKILKRDETELLVRDDASGALNFGKILSTVASVLKREEAEMLARDDASGALDIGKIVSTVAKFLKRDEADILARDDASGALDIGKIISTVAKVLKREEAELLARG